MKAIKLLKDYKKHNGRVVKVGKIISVDDATAKKLVDSKKATYNTVDTNSQTLDKFKNEQIAKE